MSNGTLIELLSEGTQAHFLTDDPDHTMWRHQWRRATNFSCETLAQNFNGVAGFGARGIQCTINRIGDLIYHQYLRFKIPGLKYSTVPEEGVLPAESMFPACDPCDPHEDMANAGSYGSGSIDTQISDPISFLSNDVGDLISGAGDLQDCTGATDAWAHWTQGIGMHLVNECKLLVGGQQIDIIDSDTLYMWEELSGVAGKRLEEMVGKRETRIQLIQDSLRDRYLYVPLPWWFTRNAGNSLPLVALQFHSVQLQMDIADLRTCIVTSKREMTVEGVTTSYVPLIKNKNTNAAIQNQDLQTRVESEYVFLSQDERNYFVKSKFEQLISVHQITEETFTTSKQHTRAIQFNHPMLEVMFRVRREKNKACNNHFNYSGMHGQDPLEYVSLKFNGMDRVVKREASWFRTVQPYQHHSSIPRSYTYCFSFAQHPELSEPSGSANFSKIDNIEFQLEFQQELADAQEQVSFKCVGRNWNLFRYKGGLGGSVYAN